MTSRHRSLALIFAVGVVTAGAVALSRRADTKPPADLVDAARPSFAYSFTPGRRLTYDVDYRSEALVDGALERSSASENAPRIDSVLTLSSTFAGTLTMTVVERRTDGSARVLATLIDLEVDVVLSDRNVALPDATFAPLARGFFIEYGPSGEVRGIAVEDDANPVAGRLASQILAFLQLQVPRGHGASWETDEKDGLGDLHARYSLVDDAPSRPGGQLIQKLVTRQRAPRTSGALGRLIATGGTAGSATLAYEVSPALGILVEAAGATTTEQVIGDLRVGSDDSTLLVRLTGDEQSDLAELRARVDARAGAVGKLRPLDPVELRAAERRSENEALLARVDVAAIVADARAHPPPPQSREAATYARILSAAVDASPEARALLEKVMLEPAIGERAFVPISRAFGEDGGPESQAALARVIGGRPRSDPGREVALFSLGRADVPTDATITLLERLSNTKEDPHTYAALLALGRAAGQVAAIDPGRGKPVLDRLVARVEPARDDVARAQLLEALGNAGSPLAEPELARWSHADVAPAVRRAAVSAYRLVPTTTARDALVSALAKDADPSVRSAALEAVLLRKPDDGIADAVADRLEHDPEESVKKPAASRLMTLCRRSERACSHIERLAKTGDEWTRHELAAFKRP
ncbi:MAG: hypothetical protein BGO98_00280 [Myxococcales bacterium 68-20]|nr:HEAT repeat domain-containing protein [Myxococcales bacterium]OJY17377.1 MAG: hypothetical protein BGO98_00280 [Myxococcales bacterium 68-20]